ncbi:MAG: C25 family cysteine peptidase, partial [candidate division WOR-3 bacterium]
MKGKILLVISLLVLLGNALNINQKINFNLSNLVIEKSDGYDLIALPGCELTDAIGEPQLPVKSLYFVLPQGARVTQVAVINSQSTILDNEYAIAPAQPPAILSKDFPIKRVEPNPVIYNSLEPYPTEIVKFIGQGDFGGDNIAMVLIYPLQYIPKTKRLKLFNELTISLEYDLTNLKLPKPTKLDSNHNFEYLVITNSAMDTVFQRLCAWKTKKGIKAVTRNIDWIYNNYPGRDNPEKIRNYLKTLYPDSGLVWLLLGGDVGIVPVRKAFAMPCSAFIHSREDSLPCDLYYSDLDGAWDFNNNNVFGEVADSVDLFPEIFVGRAPVNSISQARTFVNKIITYETNPPLDYQCRALFMGEILWTNPYTDGGVSKDWIDAQYIPARFDPITKLYERLGNQSPSTVIAAINEGKNLINHNGHGWIDAMGVGTGFLTNSDMDNLINGQRQGILYSIGCWTSAFDFDAIGEHFVRNPNGGGVAFIGHSSYGWGSPGNPRFGYSDRFDAQFYVELFNNPLPHIGQVLALAKAHFIAYSRDANVYRWHQYQLNLLGEPEMLVATDSIKNLLVFHPNSVPLGASRIVITVTDNGLPLRNALVCIQKGNEVYERGYTDFSGQVRLNINPTTYGNLTLTVTAHNFLPYQTELPVMTGPYITYLATAINDSMG